MRAGVRGGEETMLGSFFQTRRNPNPKFSGKPGGKRQIPLILELVRTLASWLAGWPSPNFPCFFLQHLFLLKISLSKLAVFFSSFFLRWYFFRNFFRWKIWFWLIKRIYFLNNWNNGWKPSIESASLLITGNFQNLISLENLMKLLGFVDD